MSLFQFTRRSIWVATIIIEILLLIGQVLTDQFSFIQGLHWPPPILIPLFGALCIVIGDTKQIRKCSGALLSSDVCTGVSMIGGRNRRSIMNSSPSHSCTGLWRKVTQSVRNPHFKSPALMKRTSCVWSTSTRFSGCRGKKCLLICPTRKFNGHFSLLPNGLLPVRWCFGKITPWSIR